MTAVDTARRFAVFAIVDGERVRISAWGDETAAHALWADVDGLRLAGRMAPAVRGYAVRATDDVDPEWSAARCSNENGIRRPYVAPEDQPIQARRTDYRKLPPLVRGFTRVRDEKIVHDGIRTAYGDGTPLPDYRRMCRCDVCGAVLPTLGIAYHQQNGPGCLARAAERKPKPTT